MSIIVQKYGGSSLATDKQIKKIACRIIKKKEEGNQLVVIVSARGDTTDELINLAHRFSDKPNERELDSLLSTGEIVSSTLLAMTLISMEYKAVSLTGFQAGIKTNASHGKARVLYINPQRILEELKNDKIVVVAGFQGIDEEMDISTLGRGGSDLTATAIAAVLKATACEIYTDVEGVFTSDPSIILNATKLQKVCYEEMLELAGCGAKVMHPRAVELAEFYNMPILVASSFSDESGTLIHEESMEIRNKIRGITCDFNVARITIIDVPDRLGIANLVFEPLAQSDISVDTIVQNTSIEGNITDISFTVSESDFDKALEIMRLVVKSIGATTCIGDSEVGKVSVIGTGMRNTPGCASQVFKTLSKNEINIEIISTSDITISCIINKDKIHKAVQALHEAFNL